MSGGRPDRRGDKDRPFHPWRIRASSLSRAVARANSTRLRSLWRVWPGDRTVATRRTRGSTHILCISYKRLETCIGGTNGDERALAECVDPVLVPKEAEELLVKTRAKDLDVKLVVLVGVDTKVLDLAERDRLVVGPCGRGGFVVLWVGTEGANVDFAG